MADDNENNPAFQLLGKVLPGGWKVIERIKPSVYSTGGNFSVGYIVESTKSGEKAFLKALDYSRALKSPDPPRALEAMTSAYNFERNILERCKEKNLDKIVKAVADGKYDVEGTSGFSLVNYLIFELADGDSRKYLDLAGTFDKAWSLRSLHHIGTGLRQLHGQSIAHQDLKPSNVLVFKGNSSKIGDVGRAAFKGHIPPHENYVIPGDPTYAPPELLFGHIDPDWNRRRRGCDLYLLGSMVLFFFMNIGMTTAIVEEMNSVHLPNSLSGTFSGTFLEALPYIRNAFGEVIEIFRVHLQQKFPIINLPNLEKTLHQKLHSMLPEMVQQLCEPEPILRGHPLNRVGLHDPLSLERYISQFNLLAIEAEYILRR